MQLINNVISTGSVSIIVTDKDNNIKDTRDIHNLVVNTGKNHFAARIAGLLSGAGLEGAIISHLGLGTSTRLPIVSDTSLATQLGSRVAISSIVHTVNTNTIIVTASFVGISGSITEAGIFNAATGGTMICRTVFNSTPVISTDVLAISWTLTIN